MDTLYIYIYINIPITCIYTILHYFYYILYLCYCVELLEEPVTSDVHCHLYTVANAHMTIKALNPWIEKYLIISSPHPSWSCSRRTRLLINFRRPRVWRGVGDHRRRGIRLTVRWAGHSFLREENKWSDVQTQLPFMRVITVCLFGNCYTGLLTTFPIMSPIMPNISMNPPPPPPPPPPPCKKKTLLNDQLMKRQVLTQCWKVQLVLSV